MDFLKNWVLGKLLDRVNEINREAWRAHRTQQDTWQKRFAEDFRIAVKGINDQIEQNNDSLIRMNNRNRKLEVAAMIFKDIHNTMDYTDAVDRAIDLAEIFIKRYEGREK